MAAKKAAPKVEVAPIPKRFDVGYRFPVMVEITEYDDSDPTETYYAVGLSESLYGGLNVFDDMFNKDRIVDIEHICNPKARKEYLSDKLKAAQVIVNSLTKEIAALDKA